MLFNNTVNYTSSGCSVAFTLREEDNDAQGECYPLTETYPGWDPIINTYYWDNLINTSITCINFVESDAVFIVKKRDYWSDTTPPQTLDESFVKGLEEIWDNKWLTIIVRCEKSSIL